MTATINASNSGSGGLISTGDASGSLALQTAGTTAVTIDASQRVGVGVTPSAWSSGGKVVQVGSYSSFADNSGTTLLSNNVYFDGTNYVYSNTAAASNYYQTGGYHVWRYAASGTAGNTVTFTEAMRIDSSGNVGIGTTSPSQKLEVATASGGTIGLRYIGNSGSATVGTDSNNNLLFSIGNPPSEKMRIAANGVLTSLATYNNVSGGSPNMFIQTDGTIYRGTSALKYKQDVRDLELIDINKFRAVRYKSKCEADDQTKDMFGLIADEVDAAGIKELVTYGADGEVENFQYDRLTVVLLKALQTQAETINALTARIVALESK